MKFELRKGSRDKKDLILIVVFEKDTNYDLEKHEWVPRLKEVEAIQTILETICKGSLEMKVEDK